MYITKFPQSCLVLELDGARIAIDPGTFVTARHELTELGRLDAVLYTHRHADHLDIDVVDQLREQGAQLFGNPDVTELLGTDRCTMIRAGEAFTAAGIAIAPYDLPHAPLVDGSPGPPNTGFVVADTLFHPGDGLELEGVQVPILAAPIAGPAVSFRDAYAMTKQLGASHVVPIHYHAFVADPHHFARLCDLAEVHVLEEGTGIELPSS